jgi:hypothetical protein
MAKTDAPRRCADAPMRRCADAPMRRCADALRQLDNWHRREFSIP